MWERAPVLVWASTVWCNAWSAVLRLPFLSRSLSHMTPTPMPESALRDATARVALAAVLHDSGKFAKRAGLGENREPGEEGKALHSAASGDGGGRSQSQPLH